jgi:hypothetical protein
MKRFLMALLVSVVFCTFGFSDSNYNAFISRGSGTKLGAEITDSRGKSFFPRAPMYMTDPDAYSGGVNFRPIFTFKMPSKQHQYKEVNLSLQIQQANEVTVARGDSVTTVPLDITAFHVQLLKVNPKAWFRLPWNFSPISYVKVGGHFELTCKGNCCSGLAPADTITDLAENFKPRSDVSVMVVGYDLAVPAKSNFQLVLFELRSSCTFMSFKW